MSDARQLHAKNLRQARQKLESIDSLIKAKSDELKQLRKERKDTELRISALTSSLNNLGEHSFDAPCTKFESESFSWSQQLKQTLRSVFRIDSFRGLQKTVINCTLSGHDCIYVAATGSGKSLVFQLSALISHGITLVVSPLISLMDDQATQLDELGIPAVVLSATATKEDFKRAMNAMQCDSDNLKLVYVTPEKLAKSKSIMAQIEKMYLAGRFSRLVIDEVHCCSQWGHDFRRDYQYLSVFKRQFPETPIIGLTATATSEVIADLQKILNIEGCYVFKGSYYRPNLKYEIRSASSKDYILDMAELIKSRFDNQCGIVYCLTVKDTEMVAEKLSFYGVACQAYHAKLNHSCRKRIQQRWYTNRCQVIAATVAFGLGINKVDVRFVIHFSLSKSLENYYQETGRAGRDGKQAHCVCYYKFADVFRATALTFTEKSGQKHVYQMLAFCLNRGECRKQLIADYFEDSIVKDSTDTQCCDNCSDNLLISKLDVRECLEDLLKILKHASQMKEKMTANKLLDSWTKSKGPSKLRVDGVRKPMLTRSECESVLGLLIVDGYLREDFHMTAYATISYILPGPRAESGVVRPLIYKLALSSPGTLESRKQPKNSSNPQAEQSSPPQQSTLRNAAGQAKPASSSDEFDDLLIIEDSEPEPKRAKIECFTID